MGEGKRGAVLPDSFLRGAFFPCLSSGRDSSSGKIWPGCPRTPLLTPVDGALTVRPLTDFSKPRELCDWEEQVLLCETRWFQVG